MNSSTVREQFAAQRAEGRRHRDAAQALGLSEGAAVAAHAGDHAHALRATPLRGPWVELLQALEACGPLLALTRNASTVHEKTGVYRNVSGEPVGLALGPDIDLRLFFAQWHAGFAVREAAAHPDAPASRSLQFFDAQGRAVHKIFAREATDLAAFDAVVERFAQPDDVPGFRPAEPSAAPRPDAEIDAAGLRQAWSAMRDTHDFFPMLRRYGAERQQALRLAEGGFTERASPGALGELLGEASMDATPIMVFVGNAGCIQIHTGPVRRVEPMVMRGQRWLNVLDAGFNLHLREDLIDSVWIVRKPTADGVVTSVEAFDAQGELMAMFFGERKPGQAELPAWRALVDRLSRERAEA